MANGERSAMTGSKSKRPKVVQFERKDLVHEASDLVFPNNSEVAAPDWVEAVDKRVMDECRVAHAQFRERGDIKTKENPDGTKMMTAHQKMKVVQDFWATAFLQPEVRRAFLMKAIEEPMQFAKIMASIMPKELNVEVVRKEGVILLPMRMDSVEEWEQAALKTIHGEVIDATPVDTENTFDWEEQIYGRPDDAGVDAVLPGNSPDDP